jgi:hypothetical protein
MIGIIPLEPTDESFDTEEVLKDAGTVRLSTENILMESLLPDYGCVLEL